MSFPIRFVFLLIFAECHILTGFSTFLCNNRMYMLLYWVSVVCLNSVLLCVNKIQKLLCLKLYSVWDYKLNCSSEFFYLLLLYHYRTEITWLRYTDSMFLFLTLFFNVTSSLNFLGKTLSTEIIAAFCWTHFAFLVCVLPDLSQFK